jgi:hypothetical protein
MLRKDYDYTQEQLDDYANQNNPNSDAYQAMLDNRANQLNPNNEEYWHSRGLDYQNPDLDD